MIYLIFGTFLYIIRNVCTLDNGVALTPPMGFMTWQRFRCLTNCQVYPNECISEELIKDMADLMVRDGYLEAGYEYIIIDDCWSDFERDENNELQPNPERFPNGMSALSQYVHNLGLKFGIYGDFGTYTCAHYPGSINHLEVDAKTFAKWEVDYIKLDGCYAGQNGVENGYAEFGQYLNETGRPIVYSCSWPAYFQASGKQIDYQKLRRVCNLWRNWGDIEDSWQSVTEILRWYGDNQDTISYYSGPGHWNDPDMLVIGNFGLSLYQSQAQMAIWSIMAAPLLMSVDLRTIENPFKKILQNKIAIAVNQDPLGIMGRLIHTVNNISIWTKPILPLVEDHYTVAIGFISYRADGYPWLISIPLLDLKLAALNGYTVENIFESEYTNVLNSTHLFVRVKPSGTVFLKLTPRPFDRVLRV